MDSVQKYAHLVGTVIDDRYEVLKVKGIGGMALVLKAKDRLKNRIVALKMLNEKHSNDSASIRRFVNESRAVALLSNEHIVDIYDVAFTGKSKYIVMEYIDGITLREYIKRNGPLGIEKSLDFTIQILSALEHAHEKGVVHRDIKPQNIMVQAGDKVKVTDFGIAQISDTKQTNSGVAMGTVYYISPEQASGKATTFSSDLYSVGIMLYEMATGKLPFEGDTPLSIAMMQVNTKPPRPRKIDPKIPQGLEQIILRAMNKTPEERFRSAKSMRRACEIVQKDKSVVFVEPKESASEEKNKNAAAEPSSKGIRENRARPDESGKNPKKQKKTRVKTPPRRFGRPTEETKLSRQTLFPIILGVTCAFLIVIAGAGIILLSSLLEMTSEDNTLLVSIPNLIDREFNASLEAELEESNILLSVKYVNNDIYDAGRITLQKPEGGQTRKLASKDKKVTVEIEVSAGKKSFSLPDFSNREYREVQLLLEKMGAKVVVQERFDSTVISGFVIMSLPKPGTYLASGDTVTLLVSKGAGTSFSNMIDVIGQTAEEAKRALLNANFIVGTITRAYSDTIPEGCVVEQSILPGEATAQKYTAVDLIVSMGKDPNPPPKTETEPETREP
ncbi:MAG: Stk1 family PASTA domain-containing Ser/Thr kinase [Clostridia bacterium]|nr:Stk1 family PASTA domain-containing Ser/Thr kinase [Clostridia bacterium]